jgi:hypothetical protein
MNHRIASLKLRSAALAACGSLVACSLWACSGDDTAQPPAGDAGPEGSTTPSDAGTDAKADSTAPLPDAASDAPLGDVTTDVRVTLDAGDAGDAAKVGDARLDSGDAGVAADADAGPTALAPLDLCPTLDTDWALTFDPDAGAQGMYDTRAGAWASNIPTSAPNGFAIALTNDCLLYNLQTFFTDGGAGSQAQYLDQLIPFSFQFFGCPLPNMTPALSFSGLVPEAAQGHTFTLADLYEIAKLYSNSTNALASINWASNLPPTAEPLTVEQINQIQDQLTALAKAYPGVNPSTTHYTLSNCPDDAGSEAGDDGGSDAGSD